MPMADLVWLDLWPDAKVGYIFEWDPKKAESNARKHGVTFNEAVTAFADPFAFLMSDPDHSVGEERYLVLGISNRLRLVVPDFSQAGDGIGAKDV